MTGLKINFKGKCEIVPHEKVDEFPAMVQNALVCLVTSVGSDKAFPEKGTRLLKQGLQGALINLATATSAAQFAAIDTLFFVNVHETEPDRRLANVALRPVVFSLGTLELNSLFDSSLGESLGVSSQVTP